MQEFGLHHDVLHNNIIIRVEDISKLHENIRKFYDLKEDT